MKTLKCEKIRRPYCAQKVISMWKNMYSVNGSFGHTLEKKKQGCAEPIFTYLEGENLLKFSFNAHEDVKISMNLCW